MLKWERKKNKDEMKKRILFICLGNICRSPAAEGVMRELVHQAGRDDEFEIDSAGIGGWHVDQLPDNRMRNHGAQRGYKFDSRARQFSKNDFSHFDYILVMDHDNFRAVSAMAPTPADQVKVRMLTDYLQHHPNASVVPDPYYGGPEDFDYALDLIEDACQGLLNRLDN